MYFSFIAPCSFVVFVAICAMYSSYWLYSHDRSPQKKRQEEKEEEEALAASTKTPMEFPIHGMSKVLEAGAREEELWRKRGQVKGSSHAHQMYIKHLAPGMPRISGDYCKREAQKRGYRWMECEEVASGALMGWLCNHSNSSMAWPSCKVAQRDTAQQDAPQSLPCTFPGRSLDSPHQAFASPESTSI